MTGFVYISLDENAAMELGYFIHGKESDDKKIHHCGGINQ